MAATTYYLRDKDGQYFTIDKDGALKAGHIQAPVTGITDDVKVLDYSKHFTFTGSARNILSRLYLGHGGTEAICFLSFDNINVSLCFYDIIIRRDSITIRFDTPAVCKRFANKGYIHISNWAQLEAETPAQ